MSWFARAFMLVGGLALGVGVMSYLTAKMELSLRASRKRRCRPVETDNKVVKEAR